MANIKKAGVEFLVTLDLGSDLTGQSSTFGAKFRKNADGVETEVVGGSGASTVTELASSPGTYQFPVTIPSVGDYTFMVNSTIPGFKNITSAVVCSNASIDDIKFVVDGLETTLAAVAADVDGLNGQGLTDIKTTLASIKTLIDDEDGATVNSVMEFVAQIDAALADGTSGLTALKGFTDDVENMLIGTEFLSDGVTANPFYDATNPGVAKESSLATGFADLSTTLDTRVTTITDAITAAKDAVKVETDAIKAVVDANKLTLEDAGYGLGALKTLIDTLSTDLGTSTTNVTNILNDATNGLAAINANITTRFDTVDATLASMDGKIDDISGGASTAQILI